MRIVVLASGEGSTFSAIVESLSADEAQVVGLVCDRQTAGAMARAEKHGVVSRQVRPKDFPNYEQWDIALNSAVADFRPDLVVLAGFLRKLGPKFLHAHAGISINTHPSLLPKHGGEGMYGRRVHEAVVAAKDLVTGITVHQVTEDYDSGPVLKQVQVKVAAADTAEIVEKNVKAVEKEFYVGVIKEIISGKISLT